jgi:hypothetical protein
MLWSRREMEALLEEVAPSLIEEYSDEFWGNNWRRVVHEVQDGRLLVVDSRLQDAAAPGGVVFKR